MRKLTNADTESVLKYIEQEPEINLFIYGDIKTCGLDGETVEIFVHETDGAWDFIILRYMTSFIIYSQNDTYDYASAGAFLQAKKPNCVSGKEILVRPLAKYFPEFLVRPTYMARANTYSEAAGTTPLTPDNANEIYELFIKIDEFRKKYEEGKEQALTEIRFNLETMGHAFGIFENERLVAIAETAAESETSAMIIGVASLPEYRGKGYATRALTDAVRYCLHTRKMKFVCLFYDNPNAARIYKKAGFEEVGKYLMLQ